MKKIVASKSVKLRLPNLRKKLLRYSHQIPTQEEREYNRLQHKLFELDLANSWSKKAKNSKKAVNSKIAAKRSVLVKQILDEAKPLSRATIIQLVITLNAKLLPNTKIRHSKLDYDEIVHILNVQFSKNLLTAKVWHIAINELLRRGVEQEYQRNIAKKINVHKQKIIQKHLQLKLKRLEESLNKLDVSFKPFKQYALDLIGIQRAMLDFELANQVLSPEELAIEKNSAYLWPQLESIKGESIDSHTKAKVLLRIRLSHPQTKEYTEFSNYLSYFKHLLRIAKSSNLNHVIAHVKTIIMDEWLNQFVQGMLNTNHLWKNATKHEISLFQTCFNESLNLLFKHNRNHSIFKTLHEIYKNHWQSIEFGQNCLFPEFTFVLHDFLQKNMSDNLGPIPDCLENKSLAVAKKQTLDRWNQLPRLIKERLHGTFRQGFPDDNAPDQFDTLHVDRGDFCRLLPDVSYKVGRLYDPEKGGKLNRTHIDASHTVFDQKSLFLKWVSLTEEGLISEQSMFPDVSLVVEALDAALFGINLAPSQLCLIKVNGIRYAVDVTLEIKGKTLKDVLDINPNFRLDSVSFFSMLISSLLGRYEDLKPDNIMVTPELRPVVIDNDMAGTDLVVGHSNYFDPEAGDHFPGLRNVLFYMQQMEDQIPESVRRLILDTPVETFLLDFLMNLSTKASYFHEHVMPLFSKVEQDFLSLPIKLEPGFLEKLEAIYVSIQQAVCSPSCTGHDILRAVSLLLFKHQQAMLEKCSSPNEAIEILYKGDHCSFEDFDIPLGKKKVPHPLDFTKNKTCSIAESIDKWMSRFDLANLTKADHVKLCQIIKNMGLPVIRQINNPHFDDACLLELTQNYPVQLKKVVFIGCPNIAGVSLVQVANNHPQASFYISSDMTAAIESIKHSKKVAGKTFIVDSHTSPLVHGFDDVFELDHPDFFSMVQSQTKRDLKSYDAQALRRLFELEASQDYRSLCSWAKKQRSMLGASEKGVKLLMACFYYFLNNPDISQEESVEQPGVAARHHHFDPIQTEALQHRAKALADLLMSAVLLQEETYKIYKDPLNQGDAIAITDLFLNALRLLKHKYSLADQLESNLKHAIFSCLPPNMTKLNLSDLTLADVDFSTIYESCPGLTELNLSGAHGFSDRRLHILLREFTDLTHLKLSAQTYVSFAGFYFLEEHQHTLGSGNTSHSVYADEVYGIF